jgi:hypothetical protein
MKQDATRSRTLTIKVCQFVMYFVASHSENLVTILESSNCPWSRMCASQDQNGNNTTVSLHKMKDFIRHPMQPGQSEIPSEHTAMFLGLTTSCTHPARLHMFNRRKEERRTDGSLGNNREMYPSILSLAREPESGVVRSGLFIPSRDVHRFRTRT